MGRIPPIDFGGIERAVYEMMKYWALAGHEITLIGPTDSLVDKINVELVGWYETLMPRLKEQRSLRKQLFHLHHFKAIDYLEKNDFDIISTHTDYVPFFEEMVKRVGPKRIVHTLHNPPYREDFVQFLRDHPELSAVALCENHRKIYGGLPNITTIFSGVDVPEKYSYRTLTKTDEDVSLPILKLLKEKNQDYIIMVGAVTRVKGQNTAIKIAQELGMPIVFAGESRIVFPEDAEYCANVTSCYGKKGVYYVGLVNSEERDELTRLASLFIHAAGAELTPLELKTIQESFGRSYIEAMATGCPVI